MSGCEESLKEDWSKAWKEVGLAHDFGGKKNKKGGSVASKMLSCLTVNTNISVILWSWLNMTSKVHSWVCNLIKHKS